MPYNGLTAKAPRRIRNSPTNPFVSGKPIDDSVTIIKTTAYFGIDFVNPVQVSAEGMDTAWLKCEYGDRIGFWGAVDTTQVLPFGTPDEICQEVKKIADIVRRDGGYIFCTAHNIQADTSIENAQALMDAYHAYGSVLPHGASSGYQEV